MLKGPSQLWSRLPALLRGAVVAFVILSVGQLPAGVFLAAGLHYTPNVPWWLAATGAWLCIFCLYLNGHWGPASTSGIRRDHFRGRCLPPRLWLWSVAAGGAGMVSVLTAALLTGSVAELPAEAYVSPLDLSRYQWWTVLAFFLNVAIVAGVVEETAFRGYMLSIVERRHGWPVAIASAAVLFYIVHLSHAYATLAFAPFFIAYGVVHGFLVFFARSILPSIVLHTLGDLAILPIQYGVIDNPLGQSVRLHLLVMVCFGLLCAWGFWYASRAAMASDRAAAA